MGKKFDVTTRHINFGVSTPKEGETLSLLQKVRGATPNHRRYLRAIEESRVTFCLGPAGTGKTWQAVGKAAAMLVEKKIDRIVISRPLVTCGRDRIGYLPGSQNDKVSAHMIPLLEAFEDFLGAKVVKQLIETRTIVLSPLELMRGSNIRNSFIILDEAQNADFTQLHMFLTRFAKGSKVVVTGDILQTDLFHHGRQNSLAETISRVQPNCHSDVSIVTLDHGDVMRDELTAWFDTRMSGNPNQDATPAADVMQGTSVGSLLVEGFTELADSVNDDDDVDYTFDSIVW